MENHENGPMTVYADKFRQKGERTLTLAEWTDGIRSGKWKTTVERLRLCRREGRAEEAERLKGSLPGLICAGDCLSGRHLKQLGARTGIAMFDQDKLSPEELERARATLRELPWVKAGHVTSSGCGWRTFVRLGEVPPERYEEAYTLVAQAIGELTGVKCDMQCKNLCRLSFASWDEEAFCKAETTLFPYPAETDVFRYVPPTGEDFSEDFRQYSGASFASGNSGAASGNSASSSSGDSGACSGYGGSFPSGNSVNPAPHYEPLRDPTLFLSTFFARKPFVEGSRHCTLLALGRYIRWKCLSPESLQTLIGEAFRACGGLTFHEFRKAMEWGYAHGQEDPSKEARKGFKGSQGSFGPFLRDGFPKPAENEEDEGNDVPDGEEREEELLDTAAYIPEEVYDRLPALLREGAAVARTRRERDMLLLAMMANLSGALPGVRAVYARKEYSPHFYFAAVAPAGSGKGVTAWGAELLKRVDMELREENRRRKKEYQSRLLAWEQEVRLALKEKRKPDESLRPEEPVCKVLLLPPNTSKSQLILDLEAAGELGVVCNATEIDSFTSSIGADHGKYSAELRKAFHHEAVGQHYKVDGRVVMVEHPRLALCMAGTLQQFTDFIGTKEDGLLSRFLFCTGKGTDEWIPAAPEEEDGRETADEVFERLSLRVQEVYHFLLRSSTRVVFTRAQWEAHTALFRRLMRQVAVERHEGETAIVARHGLIAVRLAMVLCGLRKFDTGWASEEFRCDDDDFRSALSITEALLEHSLLLTTVLPDVRCRRRSMDVFHRVMRAFKSLPELFSFSEFVREVTARGGSKSSAKRALHNMLKSSDISHDGKRYRKRPHGKKGPNEPLNP